MDLMEIEVSLSEETKSLISLLPSYTDFQGWKLYNYEGCWYYDKVLQGVLNFQKVFKPQDIDIILASYPKSGTTWHKALTVAMFERTKNNSSNDHQHLLHLDNPHNIVPFLEIEMYYESSSPDMSRFSSSFPRLFSTHLPLHELHKTIKDYPCKIVYIYRNVKDTLISWWFFSCAIDKIETNRSTLEATFNDFCDGTIFNGPFWEYVLSYWRASLEDPKHILFMRYEEIKAEPHDQTKRLAEFLGCPFTKEEEDNGLVDEILEICSLRNLTSLEVNKTGKTKTGFDHKIFFRKGEVGDAKNYLTPEMENKIDMIIQEKFQGSGFEF